jgi:hypothetical protein
LPTPGPPVITTTFEPERDADGLLLAFGKRQFRPLFDPGDRLVGIDQWPRRLPSGPRFQFLGDLPFGSM